MPETTTRPRTTLLSILLLWIVFYASFTLFTPPLLDDADSVHVEVAREMLLRHDYITLYANGIRYLEKAPLLYWSMALSMRLASLFGATEPRTLAAAARIPLALAVLALALLVETFARRLFHSTRAGLYAALISLSSFGLFLFTRITIPDDAVCLWIALALYAFYRTEELDGSRTTTNPSSRPEDRGLIALRSGDTLSSDHLRRCCYLFAAACALNVLTKGLIGVVFPVAIVAIYLLLTRGWKRGLQRLRDLHPLTSTLVFLALATPWHLLAGLANPTQGRPTPFHFVNGHWIVPLPTDGNVRGWFWFYFMNEHVLRYLNLRVPHDYDTVPLFIFWGLCFIWLMPWSAFVFKSISFAVPWKNDKWRSQLRRHDLPLAQRGRLLLVVWAAFVLLFFSLSTRQEYYVLPAFPAIAILIAGWLAYRVPTKPEAEAHRIAARRCIAVLLALGTLFAVASIVFLLHTKSPAPNTDLADLLKQNPGDYAMSMGHFLDMNAAALGLFRLPLTLAALSLFGGPLTALYFRRGEDSVHPLRLTISILAARHFTKGYVAWAGRKRRPHAANLALAAGAFGFLLAAHLGLQTFAPVLTSAQLAHAIAPQVHPGDLIVLHGEYESGSTLGFYLKRPSDVIPEPWQHTLAPDTQFIHILEGRSSNLWYGSFFPDAPKIFETPSSIAQKWNAPQRIFLLQQLDDDPRNLPPLPGPVYILVKSGGKEIVSNQPNR